MILSDGFATAQESLGARARPITVPLRHAGTYHVATGTWTRGGSQSHLVGPDIVYNNSCSPTYYVPQQSGERFQHRSRVPTTAANGAPTTPSIFYPSPRNDEAPGCDTRYLINGFEVAYCSARPSGLGTIDYVFEFANAYGSCADLDMVPDQSFVIPGLPGGTAAGQLHCWIVGIDLDGSSASFLLEADQDGTYLGPSTNEQFGYSLGPLTSGLAIADQTGPVQAGNFTWTGGGVGNPVPCTGTDGTIWDDVVDLSEAGTGMASNDFVRITGSTSAPFGPGCYDFGPNIHSDFYLKLYSDPACYVDPFVPNCRPGIDAGTIACPCNNPPAGGGLGCNNFGPGPVASGTLDATGMPSLAADTVVLNSTGSNNVSQTVFFTGSAALHPTGLVHGAGVRCVTTTLRRLYTGLASGGAISRPGVGDPTVSARTAAVGAPISAGETRHYFNIYRDPMAAGPCGDPASTINLTNSGSITWAP